MSPKLGLLITYHNEGKLLTRCLSSFFADGRGPDEVLIYDDASTNPPGPYIPAGISVRVIRGETCLGPARGRNILWREAQADYLHFHDADDWVLPEWYPAQLAAIDRGVDVLFTEVQSFRKGKPLASPVIGFPEQMTPAAMLSFFIRSFILVPSATIKREVIRELHGFRETLWQSEDYDFYVRLAAFNPKFEIETRPLVCIDVRDQSRSRNQSETASSTLQALMFLRHEIPKTAWSDLAEKAAMVGSRLFQLKERDLARDAFTMSRAFGQAEFAYQGSVYRWIARRVGQLVAEYLSAFYRGLFPAKLRSLFR